MSKNIQTAMIAELTASLMDLNEQDREYTVQKFKKTIRKLNRKDKRYATSAVSELIIRPAAGDRRLTDLVFLRDSRLGPGARGFLVTMLVQDPKSFRVNQMTMASAVGLNSGSGCQTYLRQLQKTGYARFERRKIGTTWRIKYEFSAEPVFRRSDSKSTGIFMDGNIPDLRERERDRGKKESEEGRR